MSDLGRYAAANARVRTLLPTLLGRRGLAALYSYPTVETLREALHHTVYGQQPRLRLPVVGYSTMRMLQEPEQALIRQFLLRHEVHNLKLVIRAVHRGLPFADIAPFVLPLPGVASIDIDRLISAHDLRELAERLHRTPYAASVRHALHLTTTLGSFAVEVAVELDYYDRLWLATEQLRPDDAVRAQHLLGVLYDILNLTWIARYRDGWGLSPAEIINYTLRPGRWISTRMRRELASRPELPWDLALEGTPYAAAFRGGHTDRFDAASAGLWRILAKEVERSLRGYPFHIGVPLGFLIVQELEIRDLQIVLAAKEQGVPATDTFDRLSSVRA